MSEMFFLDLCQNTYDEISIIKSLICIVKEYCLNLELNSQYYNPENFILKLSEERNCYINLLSIMQEHISNIEILNNKLESNLINA